MSTASRPAFPRLLIPAFLILSATTHGAEPLEPVRVSDDGTHFVRGERAREFVVWGVNYDHDRSGRLLDEYWLEEWETVVADFQEIKALGANCVRIHLQFGKFMESPNVPNAMAQEHLAKLVRLAEETGLYLDVTGLACYHKSNIPAWYDALAEPDRWAAQAVFWEAVAKTCRDSPAIFCYDLMNEPILPGEEPATEWLAGELDGKYFVQRLTLDLKGRTRQEVADSWAGAMVAAIRKHDPRHMITVGVIPWVHIFGGGKPLFYAPPVVDHFDFAAVHFYPKKGEVPQALEALSAYDVGKPLVIEETFPLGGTADELVQFIDESAERADGWISFYWGATADELRNKPDAGFTDQIIADWLDRFHELSGRVTSEN